MSPWTKRRTAALSMGLLMAAAMASPAAAIDSPSNPKPAPAVSGDFNSAFGALGCMSFMPFMQDMGPFGPLGPWGPLGPKHGQPKPEPQCSLLGAQPSQTR